jgi:hypothetical protein
LTYLINKLKNIEDAFFSFSEVHPELKMPLNEFVAYASPALNIAHIIATQHPDILQKPQIRLLVAGVFHGDSVDEGWWYNLIAWLLNRETENYANHIKNPIDDEKKPFIKGSIGEIGDTPFATQLWDFCNSQEALTCLKVTSFLGCAAVDGLQLLLFEKIDKKQFYNQKVKQMIGRMVKQIMQTQGYVVDVKATKTRQKSLFSTGARYKTK